VKTWKDVVYKDNNDLLLKTAMLWITASWSSRKQQQWRDAFSWTREYELANWNTTVGSVA